MKNDGNGRSFVNAWLGIIEAETEGNQAAERNCSPWVGTCTGENSSCSS